MNTIDEEYPEITDEEYEKRLGEEICAKWIRWLSDIQIDTTLESTRCSDTGAQECYFQYDTVSVDEITRARHLWCDSCGCVETEDLIDGETTLFTVLWSWFGILIAFQIIIIFILNCFASEKKKFLHVLTVGLFLRGIFVPTFPRCIIAIGFLLHLLFPFKGLINLFFTIGLDVGAFLPDENGFWELYALGIIPIRVYTIYLGFSENPKYNTKNKYKTSPELQEPPALKKRRRSSLDYGPPPEKPYAVWQAEPEPTLTFPSLPSFSPSRKRTSVVLHNGGITFTKPKPLAIRDSCSTDSTTSNSPRSTAGTAASSARKTEGSHHQNPPDDNLLPVYGLGSATEEERRHPFIVFITVIVIIVFMCLRIPWTVPGGNDSLICQPMGDADYPGSEGYIPCRSWTTLARFTVIDHTACCMNCSNEKRCQAWHYTARGSTCWLLTYQEEICQDDPRNCPPCQSYKGQFYGTFSNK